MCHQSCADMLIRSVPDGSTSLDRNQLTTSIIEPNMHVNEYAGWLVHDRASRSTMHAHTIIVFVSVPARALSGLSKGSCRALSLCLCVQHPSAITFESRKVPDGQQILGYSIHLCRDYMN